MKLHHELQTPKRNKTEVLPLVKLSLPFFREKQITILLILGIKIKKKRRKKKKK